MSFRDRPRLSDRLRGKSGDELINEIKKEFENDKKAWFHSRNPRRFGSLREEAFPFDEDVPVFSQKGDAGIKSHLEDLAKKHPEFASDLRCPPWGGSAADRNWEKAFTVPILVEKNGADVREAATCASSSQNSSPASDQHSRAKSADSLGCQSSLRNTVDVAERIQKANREGVVDEPERSSSAPPDTSVECKKEPKRFTSKIEITPINPFEQNPSSESSAENGSSLNAARRPATTDTNPADVATSCAPSASVGHDVRPVPIITDANILRQTDCTAPSTSPASPSTAYSEDAYFGKAAAAAANEEATDHAHESPQTSRRQPQVHHIPIFVEGRSEPVVSKHADECRDQGTHVLDQAPLKRKLDGTGAVGVSASENDAPCKQNLMTFQEKKVPVETLSAPTAAAAAAAATTTDADADADAESQLPPQPSTFPQQPFATASVPPPVVKTDSLELVQHVLREVDELTKHIERYSGTSRNDKEYLFFDEMLTRNLIKLDTIEVEGNEQLRTARRSVIKSIHKSISLLESKVPVSKNQTAVKQSEELQQNGDNCAATSDVKMDVDLNGANSNCTDETVKNGRTAN